MPELPEVETIVGDLNRKLKNKKIQELKVIDAKALNLSLAYFKKLVIGRKIKLVRRRAKIIIIELEDDSSAYDKKLPRALVFLVIHLKMTGQLVYKSKRRIIAGGHPIIGVDKILPNKFTRVVFKFKDNSELFFNDVRRFGWIKFVDSNGLKDIILKLGVEPLSGRFSLEKFKEILSHKQNTTIKQAILDQKYLAGLGNIYVDESLFIAGVRPMRRVKTLSQAEIKKIWQAIPKILRYAIKHRGTSFNNYIDATGRAGNYVSHLKVYGRAGKRCKKCANIIKKIKLGGRGTHWCDYCQK